MNGFLLSELFNQSFDVPDASEKAFRLAQPMHLAIVKSRGTESNKTYYSVSLSLANLLTREPNNQHTLFPLYQNSKDQTSVKTLNLTTVVIDQFSKVLKLGFSPSQSFVTSNVCLAEAPGVRPEFKVSFSEFDLFDYALACVWNQEADQPIIPLPEDEQQFWELVKAGGEIRRKPGLN